MQGRVIIGTPDRERVLNSCPANHGLIKATLNMVDLPQLRCLLFVPWKILSDKEEMGESLVRFAQVSSDLNLTKFEPDSKGVRTLESASVQQQRPSPLGLYSVGGDYCLASVLHVADPPIGRDASRDVSTILPFNGSWQTLEAGPDLCDIVVCKAQSHNLQIKQPTA